MCAHEQALETGCFKSLSDYQLKVAKVKIASDFVKAHPDLDISESARRRIEAFDCCSNLNNRELWELQVIATKAYSVALTQLLAD